MTDRKSECKSEARRLAEEAIHCLRQANKSGDSTARAYEREALGKIAESVEKLAAKMEMLLED